MSSEKNFKSIVGEFISVDEACRLKEGSPDGAVQSKGTLTLHHVHCERRGNVILVEGGSGDFAVLNAEV